MLGLPVGQPPTATPDGKIVPFDRHNLQVMSMGMMMKMTVFDASGQNTLVRQRCSIASSYWQDS